MKNWLTLALCLTQLYTVFGQWTEVEIPTQSGLNDAFFTDVFTGYVVGGGNAIFELDTTDAVIYKTLDGGDTWDLLYSNDSLVFKNVFVINDVVYVYGKSTSSISVLTRSFDDGVTWEDPFVLEDNIQQMELYDDVLYYTYAGSTGANLKRIESDSAITIATDVTIFGINGDEVIYVNGPCDTIFKSMDKGDTWGYLPSVPGNLTPNNSPFATIKSFGDKIRMHLSYPNHHIYSNDNGATWIFPNSISGMIETTIVNDSTVYGISPSKYQILVSANYPQSTIQLSNSLRKLRGMYFYDHDFGVLTGDKGLLYMIDNAYETLNIPSENAEVPYTDVYPNPARTNVYINTTNLSDIEKIELFDVNSKLLRAFSSNTTSIDVSEFSKGIYMLKISTANKTYTSKLVLE